MLNQTQANRRGQVDGLVSGLHLERDVFIDSYEQDQREGHAKFQNALFLIVCKRFEKALRLFLSKHKSQLHVMTNFEEELEARTTIDSHVLSIRVRHETTADQWNLSFVLGEDRAHEPEVRVHYAIERLNAKGEYERRRNGVSFVMNAAHFLSLGDEIFVRDHFIERGAQVDPKSAMMHTFNTDPVKATKPQAPKRKTVEQKRYLELLEQERLRELAMRMDLA